MFAYSQVSHQRSQIPECFAIALGANSLAQQTGLHSFYALPYETMLLCVTLQLIDFRDRSLDGMHHLFFLG